ncbi:spore coat protein YlbD [Jeotgalibacillus salarius]|uniref:Cytosolic protein n=1 Tax=Jeotgalibacillus salarius TaxID=546023 RepID=A0A4Y8LGT7_9BACL|nr:spore coat protein YlbD [Jeotgalibacillus salarius]TFE00261.1 hypothetical protein E2626_12320 [Jeotgalibacillus salarius]
MSTHIDQMNDFKEYLRKNPDLIKKVRREEATWQELYEDWLIFGNERKSSSIEFEQVFSAVKEKIQHIDPSQIEKYSKQIQTGLDFFQEMLNNFNKQSETKNDAFMNQWKQ